jgi:hypothetical protein
LGEIGKGGDFTFPGPAAARSAAAVTMAGHSVA